jgi:type IV pilus assembly protein PilA
VKVFCSRCGREKEIEDAARHAFVTCAGCGQRYSPAGPVAAPSSNVASTVGIVIAVIVGGMAVVAVIGILAAIAIPNFIRFQARSKQSECKTNLSALARGWQSYFATRDAYPSQLRMVGFAPERGNRYAYFAGDGTMELRDALSPVSAEEDTQIGVDRFRYPQAVALSTHQLPRYFAGDVTLGIHGTCPDCFAVAACIGNIDNDSTLDVWSVSTRARVAPSGEEIPALVPFNDVDDVSE